GQFPLGRVGQVGGDGVEPVESGRGGDGVGVALPGDGGCAVCGDAGGDGDQVGDAAADDGGAPVVDLLAGLVVTPAETVADASERFLGPGQGAVAGLGDGAGLLGGPDVGDAQPVGGAGVGVIDVAVT